jgi:hypothetical protein
LIDPDVDGMMKRIVLMKEGARMWSGLIWLRICISCARDSISCSVKGGIVLGQLSDC